MPTNLHMNTEHSKPWKNSIVNIFRLPYDLLKYSYNKKQWSLFYPKYLLNFRKPLLSTYGRSCYPPRIIFLFFFRRRWRWQCAQLKMLHSQSLSQMTWPWHNSSQWNISRHCWAGLPDSASKCPFHPIPCFFISRMWL